MFHYLISIHFQSFLNIKLHQSISIAHTHVVYHRTILQYMLIHLDVNRHLFLVLYHQPNHLNIHLHLNVSIYPHHLPYHFRMYLHIWNHLSIFVYLFQIFYYLSIVHNKLYHLIFIVIISIHMDNLKRIEMDHIFYILI